MLLPLWLHAAALWHHAVWIHIVTSHNAWMGDEYSLQNMNRPRAIHKHNPHPLETMGHVIKCMVQTSRKIWFHATTLNWDIHQYKIIFRDAHVIRSDLNKISTCIYILKKLCKTHMSHMKVQPSCNFNHSGADLSAHLANIMAADVLAPWIAKLSAAMVLIMYMGQTGHWHISCTAGIAWLCTLGLLVHSNSERHIKFSIFFPILHRRAHKIVAICGKGHIDTK